MCVRECVCGRSIYIRVFIKSNSKYLFSIIIRNKYNICEKYSHPYIDIKVDNYYYYLYTQKNTAPHRHWLGEGGRFVLPGRAQRRWRTLTGLVAPPADSPLHYPAGLENRYSASLLHKSLLQNRLKGHRTPAAGRPEYPSGSKTGSHLAKLRNVKLFHENEEELRAGLTGVLIQICPAKLTCCIHTLQWFPNINWAKTQGESLRPSSSGQTLAS